jgi:cytochrome c553|nr:MAG: cytochrome C [Pseudomonadota bacterium]
MSGMVKILLFAASLAACVPAAAAGAQAACGGCHALSRPDFDRLGITERLERKAPPLWYAGNKYRREWLVQWLQAPTRLLAAGYFPNAAIRSTAEGDEPDPDRLPKHPALSRAEAESVADELMAKKPHDALIAAARYEPGSVNRRMGAMDFGKFKGCQACHQDEPGKGGLSGPELYTAWQRLTPEYIVSFIADPKAWDPNTIMPRMEMNDAAISKLADYLKLIGGGQ